MLQVAEGQQRLLKLAEEAAGAPVVPSFSLCTQYKTIRLEICQKTLHVIWQCLPHMGSAHLCKGHPSVLSNLEGTTMFVTLPAVGLSDR